MSPVSRPKNSQIRFEYLISISAVAICSAISVLLRSRVAQTNLAIIYILGVLAVSVRCGRRTALFNAFLMVAAFHYFCVLPFDSFKLNDDSDLITIIGMLIVALVTTTLTVKIRNQAAEAIEREEQTRELFRLRQEAEIEVQNERTRNALLSAVSHDIKTPLASIYGAATSLLEEEGRLDSNARRELVESISDDAERLNRVVTNLLEMTRLNAGLQPARDWYPLEEIIGSALTRLEKSLRGRQITANVAPDLPLVYVDGVLLEQVFVNLLENVAKYTPKSGQVKIVAESNGSKITVSIEDQGPGFAPGDEAHLFDKFFRGKVEGVRGVGLGLAICKAIVEIHDGTITAANSPLGGAMVRFELPVGGVPPDMTTTSESSIS
jgi:two-component system, OmpR family, sensor histidine kinase KdpD